MHTKKKEEEETRDLNFGTRQPNTKYLVVQKNIMVTWNKQGDFSSYTNKLISFILEFLSTEYHKKMCTKCKWL